MKHLLWTVVFSIIFTIPAYGFEAGDAANYQDQAQVIGGVDYGLNGADSKYVGGQVDIGASTANGGFGIEYNYQSQGVHINAINSTATVRHQYDIDMSTRGASDAVGYGTGGHIEGNEVEAGIATYSNGVGTGMASGAGINAAGGSLVGATVNADAVGMTDTTAHTEYESINMGLSSAQYSTGVSDVEVHTVAYSDIGFAGAAGTASTSGGTVMVNDGMGGAMTSAGVSHSEVDIATAGVGAGYSGASASATNTHYSEQASYGAGTYQYQETLVSTGAAE